MSDYTQLILDNITNLKILYNKQNELEEFFKNITKDKCIYLERLMNDLSYSYSILWRAIDEQDERFFTFIIELFFTIIKNDIDIIYQHDETDSTFNFLLGLADHIMAMDEPEPTRFRNVICDLSQKYNYWDIYNKLKSYKWLEF